MTRSHSCISSGVSLFVIVSAQKQYDVDGAGNFDDIGIDLSSNGKGKE